MNIQEPRRRSRRLSAVLDLDLNAAPTPDNLDLDGSSNQNRSLDSQPTQGRRATVPEPIDLVVIDDDDDGVVDDDDVVISTRTAFAEAKKNPKRYEGCTVVSEAVDVDTAERFRAKKRKLSACLSKNVENCNKKSSVESVALPLKPPLPPKEPSFSCPVCMGPLVQEMSTRCGHIFCKGCIKTAVAVQSKCPTCRKKITLKDLIRVYLPATSVN